MYVGTVHHIVFTCILIFILKVKGEGEGNIFCNIDVLYHLVHTRTQFLHSHLHHHSKLIKTNCTITICVILLN